ncbi:MAG: exo-alpha-sialidase, partial [Candidatus Brockarchaeota archaeon]|nr:exo-alpha-sialidase [Candidatus Brockarchaeota archaeon]
PCLLVTASGKVILFHIHWRSLKDSRIAWSQSLDNGRTWGPAVEVETGHRYNDLNRNGIVLSDGKTLVQGFSWEKRADSGEEPVGETDQLYSCSLLRSTDDGETWEKGGDVVFDEATGVDEPTVVELVNGDIYMLMRSGVGWLYQAASSDKGETWGKATATSLRSPNAPAMLYRLSLRPSKVIVVWDNSPPAGRWIAPGKVEGTIHEPRYPLDAAVSYDECETWAYSRTLTNPGRQASYPSVTLTSEGHILAVWQEETEEPGRRDIKYAKFNEEWIKMGIRHETETRE